MTLKQTYKNQIKQHTVLIKKLKFEIRQSKDFTDQEKSYKQSELHSLKIEARYTFLAYATIRGKDLSLIESNPRESHDPEKLSAMLTKMERLNTKELCNVAI